jgi:chloride channel 3/4/5
LAYSRLSVQRPISAYDAVLPSQDIEDETDFDAKINGIRVWYSSFTSIDWLHDAIKDSLRFSRLRKRKSLRARIRLAFDKSLGWIIVTIAGFWTAVVAFLIIRSEQWLFDLKEGYCGDKWWKAKRFCCPQNHELVFLPDASNEESCDSWKTWSEAFSWKEGARGDAVVEYLSYTVIAVSGVRGSLPAPALMPHVL